MKASPLSLKQERRTRTREWRKLCVLCAAFKIINYRTVFFLLTPAPTATLTAIAFVLEDIF